MRILMILVGLIVLAVGGAYGYAKITAPKAHAMDTLMKAAFGPADMGPVNFGAIVRSGTGNDALACPEGACGSAAVDRPSQTYAFAPGELGAAIGTLLAEGGATERVFISEDGLEQRFVVRTRTMRYPDTVAIRMSPAGDAGTAVSIYSRSKLGQKDFGVNLARVDALLAGLKAKSDQAIAARPAAAATIDAPVAPKAEAAVKDAPAPAKK
jgi:uncharacterized protein (DUF1499 family)